MPGGRKQIGHPEVWAFLTIITFPIVLIATDVLGAKGLWPFGFAVLSTFLILTLEAIVRGQLWPFEEKFVKHISHPELPLRVLLILGGALLILETGLIFAVTSDIRFDTALLSLVMEKECAVKNNSLADKLCQFLKQPYLVPSETANRGELTGYAVRKYAATAWFPKENLVTCAERIVAQNTDKEITRELHLLHCSAWKIVDGGLRVKSKKTAFAGSSLMRNDDGTYAVTAWTEDPNSEQWKAALGSISEVSRNNALSLAILPEFEEALKLEAKVRAADYLKK